MKHIIKFFFIALAVALYSGCTPQEDDLFGESAANRMTAVLKADMDVLCAPKNGWIMEYYPSATQQYGGYNVWVSFSTDGSVKAMSEIYGASTVETSLFSLKQSAGPELTFDTYNKVVHYFSDPANPDGIGTDGKGMEGDFEFTILKAKADTVILKGKKSGSRIVMVALPDMKTGADYIASVIAADKQMTCLTYSYEVNGKSIPVTVNYRNLSFTYLEGGSQVIKSVPYIVTPTGYKLYSPLTIEGITVQELTYKQSGTSEFFEPTNGAAAKLVTVIHSLSEQLLSNNWYFIYSGLGAYGKAYWDYTKTNGLDVIREELYYAYLGKSSTGTYGFNFSSYDGAAFWKGVLTYGYTMLADNQVKFTLKGYDSNGQYYYSKVKFNSLIIPIGTTTGKTFTITTDNIKNPKWMKLTDNADANNTMVLYKSQVYWPYDN